MQCFSWCPPYKIFRIDRFESQHKLVFLYFVPKNLPKYFFFKRHNQIRPMSFLSHTGGADSGHSWLVVTKKNELGVVEIHNVPIGSDHREAFFLFCTGFFITKSQRSGCGWWRNCFGHFSKFVQCLSFDRFFFKKMINPVRDAGRIYGEFSPRLGIFPFFLEIKNETGKITSEFFSSISKYGFEKCKGSLHSGTSSPFHLSTANSKCLVLCGNTVTCQNLLIS